MWEDPELEVDDPDHAAPMDPGIGFCLLALGRYARHVPTITSLALPIDWTTLGWPESPRLGDLTLVNGDPRWAWDPAAPAFEVTVMETVGGVDVDGFTVDHVVLLVPDIERAIATLERIDLLPRLRMTIRGDRPAAFFRVGPVLEVIEAPVRQASLYGIAVTSEKSLESVSIAWKARGLDLGDISPAIQPGRRIMTLHGVDAGFAVMSPDRATA